MVREFTDDQRTFIVTRKLQNATLATIRQEYSARWPPATWHVVNAPPPATKKTLRRLLDKFRQHATVQDRRKPRSSARQGAMTVRTQGAIDNVRIIKFLLQLHLRSWVGRSRRELVILRGGSTEFFWGLWGLCFFFGSEKNRVFLGTLGTLFFFQLWKKTEFFWGLKKLVILRGAPVKKFTLYYTGEGRGRND